MVMNLNNNSSRILLFANYIFWSFVLIVLLHVEICCNASDNKSDVMNSKNFCAYFTASHNSSFPMYDREAHNSHLAEIISSDLQKKIQSVQVQEGCQLLFCSPDLFNNSNQQRFCDAFSGNADLSAYKYLYADSASCSCKKPENGCRNHSACENINMNEDVDHDICVYFFKESNCSKCLYDDPYELRLIDEMSLSIKSKNSFSVGSMVIRHDCELVVKSFGLTPAYYKGGAYNSIQLAYVRNPEPAVFSCTCGSKGEYATTMKTSIKIIIGLATTVVVVLIFVSGIIGFKYYKVRRKLLKYSDEAIQRFTHGESSVHDGEVNATFSDIRNYSGDEFCSKNARYISMGYVEALRQPYLNQYEVPIEKVTIHENLKLGEGNFGKVCSGSLTKANGEVMDVAIKIAKGSTTSVIYFVSLLDEIKILSYLGSHPNIVCIVGACTQNIQHRDALLLLELCSKGNLKNYLCRNRDSYIEKIFSENSQIDFQNQQQPSQSTYQAWSIVSIEMTAQITKLKPDALHLLLKWSQEIASGMEYLCSKNVVHIDLAARNVLLTDQLMAKICDFGLSRRIQAAGNYVKIGDDYGLPINWMALESLLEQRFTPDSDIWSYGVVLWEIFTIAQEPYQGLRLGFTELKNYLQQGKRLKKPEYASNEIYSKMNDCWNAEPSLRPTFHDLKQYFSKLLCDEENSPS